MTPLQEELFSLRDEEYKAFHAKLIPNVSPERIIGIRTPVLRKFARGFSKTPEASIFINTLPHKYYEENNLHAFILETIKDYGTALSKTAAFLPYIDNWATCDMFFPPVFKGHSAQLMPEIQKWLRSSSVYTVRYAIGLMMKLCLDDDFTPEYLKLVASVKSDEYYVNMMIAWFFATALAKQYDDAIVYLYKHMLPSWIHNKTIQKATESNRISPEVKAMLKKMKIK